MMDVEDRATGWVAAITGSLVHYLRLYFLLSDEAFVLHGQQATRRSADRFEIILFCIHALFINVVAADSLRWVRIHLPGLSVKDIAMAWSRRPATKGEQSCKRSFGDLDVHDEATHNEGDMLVGQKDIPHELTPAPLGMSSIGGTV
jgi:hypothetical protein